MKWILRAPMLSSLLLATLVLAGTATIFLYLQTPTEAITGKTTPIAIDSFRFIKGGGKQQPGLLTIERYTNGQAIISNLQGLENSGRFRYLRFQLTPAKLMDDLPLFFWRSAKTGRLHTMALEENILDHLDLKRHKQWGGPVSEYGFIFSEKEGQHWRLQELGFSPDTLEQTYLSIFSDWLEFEVWSQHSVNFLYGGAQSHLPATIVVGAWVLLALLFYSLLMRRKKQALDPRKIAAVLLFGWMLLDARWLFNLFQQAQLTHNIYTGKASSEQYEAALDADYYRYFQHLKKEVLPAEPQFIYVLDKNSNYFRAKTPWWLAPHNVFNQDSYPRPEYGEKGGYILILHPVPGLQFDARTQALRWGNNGNLPVTPAYLDPRGALYKIRESGH
ncbi:hypothetical protein [Thiolapillus sp.]